MKKVLKLLAVTGALILGACGSKDNTARNVTRASSTNPAPPYVTNAINGSNANGAQWVSITGITLSSATAYVNGAVTLGSLTGCANCGGYFNISQNPTGNNFSALSVSMTSNTYTVTGSPGVLTVMIIDSDYSSLGPIWATTNLSQGTMNYGNANNGSGGSFTLNFGDGSSVGGAITGQAVQSGAVDFSGNQQLGGFQTNICYLIQCSS